MHMKSIKATKWNSIIFLLVVLIFFSRWSFFQEQNAKPIVILSSNFNYRYLFLLPFTVSLWKRIGIDSIIIFVGNKNIFITNHRARETIKNLEEMNATILFFQSNHLSTASFSQIIRLFGAVLPLNIPDERIILTSDADLAVFSSSNHIPNLIDKKTVRLYNSKCCGNISVPLIHGNFEVKMYPMGTIGATKKVWREIMGFKRNQHFNEEDVEKYVIAEFGDNFFYSTDDKNPSLIGSSIWYADQSLFSYKFDQWFKKFSNKVLVSYHLDVPRRIDRIQWPSARNFSQLDVENFDDTHLPISAYSDKEWEKFMPFINFAFKDDKLLIQKLQNYRKSFCNFNIVEYEMIKC